MGSTNLEVEQRVLAEAVTDSPATKDEENAAQPVSESPGEKESEPTFDTGLFSWLQVLGSFFLFFNSWYVPARTGDWPLLTTSYQQGCN